MKFTITTYNILADAYMRRSHYPDSADAAIAKNAREALLLKTIAEHDSDIFCLQEVELIRFEKIQKILEDHVGFLVQKKDKPEGCAVFVRKSFPNIVFSEIRFKHIREKKNQVAALVQVDVGTSRIGISSTHLQWMKNSADASTHLGRMQLEELMDHVDDWIPWIHCGDFNALSQSCVLQTAEEKGFVLSCRSQRPWDTTNINGRRRKIDYLIYPENKFEVRPFSLPKLASNTPMPSEIYASDHLPVKVEFEI